MENPSMSFNVLKLAKAALENHIGTLSGILDTTAENVFDTSDRVLTEIVSGLIQKSQTTNGAAELSRALDDHDDGFLENLGGWLGGGNHIGLLNRTAALPEWLFGNDLAEVVKSIDCHSELDPSRITTLLRLVLPTTLGVVATKRRTDQLNASSLADLLSAQAEHLASGPSQEPRLPTSIASEKVAEESSTESPSEANPVISAPPLSAEIEETQPIAPQGTDLEPANAGFLWSLLPLGLLAALAVFAYSVFNNQATTNNPSDGIDVESRNDVGNQPE